ncbi:MAG: hypothetical protein ACLFS6_09620, partial [Methanomassiliicoccales archaeon]
MATQICRDHRAESRMEDSEESVLRLPYTASLLLMIYDEREIIASQMKRICKNYTTMASLAKRLEEEGLVEVVMRTSPRVTHIYFLSDRGRKVAERLREVE